MGRLALLRDNPAWALAAVALAAHKRLDGVTAALGAIVAACFPGGAQSPALAAEPSARAQVIWGKSDRIIPASHATALGADVPVHILDDSGHLPHMEKAAEVNRLIAAFIGV